MFNRENELMLFAEWINGRHTEDIAQLEEKVFNDRELFKAIRDEGITLTELGASKSRFSTSLSELAEFIGSGAFYRGALGDALDTQRDLYIERLRNDKDNELKWIDKITEITNKIKQKDANEALEGFSDKFFAELEERRTENNPHYGLKLLDEKTRGLHRGQLVTACARPGCGKSVFGLQVADHARAEGFKILYIPLEMTPYETFKRLVTQGGACDIDNMNEIEEGLPQSTITQIRDYLNEIEDEGLFKIYYGLNGLADIEKKIKEEKPYLVVIDQLSLIEPAGRYKDIRDKYTQVTGRLKQIALRENVCIFELHQLNRSADEMEKLTLSNLAESDSVGRDSDVVLVFKTKGENPQLEGLIQQKLTILKNRSGEAGTPIYTALHGAQAKISLADKNAYEGAGKNDANADPKNWL